MITISYKLTLCSDAEIGTGLGGELLNDLVARDHRNQLIIRASHLKGLLREQLLAIGKMRGWDKLADDCLGEEGPTGDGWVQFTDAKAPDGVQTLHISRTALTELGTVADGSLRTTEAVPVGTCFTGTLRSSAQLDQAAQEVVATAMRLALLSLGAVGGSRTRGGGACHVDLESDDTPGTLLKVLDAALANDWSPAERDWSVPQAGTPFPKGQPVVLRLIYEADAPVCCPELPVSENNVIRTGLGIPASAVQGAIITRLAEADAVLAQTAFEDSRTRAWPLLPCAEESSDVSKLSIPVRVALSHRMSKLTDNNGDHSFKDAAIQPYDWREVAKGSPLKGADGVILRNGDQENNTLWRSGDMARVISSHARHYKERNLFTVESLAPMVFSGWMSLPQAAADALCASLAEDPVVAFGKSRSVRGSGRLRAEPVDWTSLFDEWCTDVLVLQSPVVLPDNLRSAKDQILDRSAETLMTELVEQAGWGQVKRNKREPHQILIQTQAACGVRFGWNRHSGDEALLKGRRVLLPGSVVVLERKLGGRELIDLLLRGLGDDESRRQGFGAVLPHPGVAKKLFKRRQEDDDMPVGKSSAAGHWAFTWYKDSGWDNGPSPSQISAVAERIDAKGGQVAAEYLERQKKERPARVWSKWEEVYEDVLDKVNHQPAVAKQALRTWQDLVVANRSSDKDKGEQ